MSYFAVDDEMHVHPKMVLLSLAAVGLWARCGSWAKKYRTGGFVPTAVVKTFGGSRKLALELCAKQMGQECSLWWETEGGYQFHDWESYQAQGKGLVLTNAEKQAAYRQRERDKKRYQESNADGNADGNEKGNEVTALPARAHAHGVGVGVGNVLTPSSPEHSSDPRPHDELCARWAADTGIMPIDVPSASREAARQAVAKLERAGVPWPEAYARWRADEFVQREEPPLTHFAGSLQKYVRDRKAPAKGAAKPSEFKPATGELLQEI